MVAIFFHTLFGLVLCVIINFVIFFFKQNFFDVGTFHRHSFCLWNVLSMKCLWNVLSMKYLFFKMFYFQNVLSLKCPIYVLYMSYKLSFYEMIPRKFVVTLFIYVNVFILELSFVKLNISLNYFFIEWF